ncbi:MAG: Flp pilus assembly complex ATPase component TadA [Pseudomonadota bacterium]|nr:Flp pilus assembly complex ATPase component TadA [Pseudomonadota bacterium]
MDDTVTCSRVGATTVVSPSGPLLDAAAHASLLGAFASCFAANQTQLVVDLGRVAALNGRALEIALDAAAKSASLGGRLKIINPNPLVRDIVVATGLAERLALPGPGVGAKQLSSLNPRKARKRLGEILVARGALTEAQLAEITQLQQESGKRLGQLLIERRVVAEADLLDALAEQLGVPLVALRAGLYEAAASALLPREVARRLEVLPLFKVQQTLTVATSDPQAVPVFDEIRKLTGCTLRIVLSRRDEILKSQFDAYSSGGDYEGAIYESQAPDLELVDDQIPDDYTAIDQMAGASPVINLVNGLIQSAIRDKASDIHIEITRGRSRVRFRVDGVLYEVMTPRTELHPAIVSRLKVMASLDIAERRMPQDGRIQVATQGRTVDLRFSSLPGIHGEKVVLRVLDKNQSILDVDKLGMSSDNCERFKQLLGLSHGLILVTGPTGSGKTTTLYAAVNYLKSMETNIVTIEDPVEYQLDIINQNQVNDAIGLTFPKILKHVLRQDPDVVMVGEIRDRQTAEIAVQAALTGHLVLSTLHTNDAIGALSRMIDMGVQPYLLASALVGVVAQRLVRQVCSGCKTTYLAPAELVAAHGWSQAESIRLVKGRGCTACYDSGYKGRLGIHELLQADDSLRALMARDPSRDDLAAFVKRSGHRSLFDDGLRRVLEGGTTVEEVGRVIHAG